MGLWISDHWRRMTPAVFLLFTGVLQFICSISGWLSFPEGNTQHARALWLTKGIASPKKKQNKKQSVRENGRSRPRVWPFDVPVSVCTASLSPLPMQKTGLYLLWFRVPLYRLYVFVCFCRRGLFEDVHSKTGRSVVGGIKVLTPLH